MLVIAIYNLVNCLNKDTTCNVGVGESSGCNTIRASIHTRHFQIYCLVIFNQPFWPLAHFENDLQLHFWNSFKVSSGEFLSWGYFFSFCVCETSFSLYFIVIYPVTEYYNRFLYRLRSIAAHRDHFVRRLSVCLSGSHTFLVVSHSYVSQATHAFLGKLPLH